MAFNKKTIRDIDLTGKTVLMSVDYNVSANADGSLGELFRVEATLPTLKYLLSKNCRIILISHRGKPHGHVDKGLSLQPIAEPLAKFINHKVEFAPDCIGAVAQAAATKLAPGGVLLLENTRFHMGEEENDPAFAKELANLAPFDAFVQEAFGNAHREHASLVAVTKFLPSVAGLLLEKEVNTITAAVEKPTQPLLVILGGAKVSDKIELIDKLSQIANDIVIGGAMANTFLAEMGYKIGKSVYEAEALAEAKRLRSQTEARGVHIYLPTSDVAVAKGLESDEERVEKSTTDVAEDEFILDFGPLTTSDVENLIRNAGSVIWNGPVGMTEFPNFTSGSLHIAQTIAEAKVPSLAGGGDTAAFLEKHNLLTAFDWVSTGGGASLELMAGKPLPGVESLLDK